MKREDFDLIADPADEGLRREAEAVRQDEARGVYERQVDQKVRAEQSNQ